MPIVKWVDLSALERAALEHGSEHGATASFRRRCQMILLKAQKLPSAQVAQQVGCCEVVVNHWLKRFQAEGIDGLHLRKGRGRHAILQTATDLEAVRRAVQANRQRISLAKAELEQELGKQFSTLTLKRFVKKTVAASNGCEGE